MSFAKGQFTLTTLDEWAKHAGPKSAHQWVEGRSAMEVARAWLGGGGDGLPQEVATALSSHPGFGAVLDWIAEPEARLRFDRFAGEPRNSDLAVHARDEFGRYLIAVEAKADESYGETVHQTLLAAERRRIENPRSNGITRVEHLCQALLGATTNEKPELLGLRYQLLTACAGALCEAERRGYTRAVMLIHEFVTSKTTDENHARNERDLQAFLNALSPGALLVLASGSLYGPILIPGAPLLQRPVALYIGKVTRNLRNVGTFQEVP